VGTTGRRKGDDRHDIVNRAAGGGERHRDRDLATADLDPIDKAELHHRETDLGTKTLVSASTISAGETGGDPGCYQFSAERSGAFRWHHLERGPETWRVEITKEAEAITADQTVADVLRRSEASRTVMQRMGINHCCGAHLTLTDTAAAAGVPVDSLVRALRDAESAAA
jgi:uncharacterized protein (DUF2249 family)